ncbi:hypothetical protein HPB50_021146 [Hyalomma asiaticum]|uniref:Uncharacterized protein n=1 Tax=Hyalomma asiaticum TaxID=266040 RepID=A0ACB7TLI6_HYAAI|nr:hypothetical protein HPB50_021146 [Hyalomma asiaticum]
MERRLSASQSACLLAFCDAGPRSVLVPLRVLPGEASGSARTDEDACRRWAAAESRQDASVANVLPTRPHSLRHLEAVPFVTAVFEKNIAL